MARSSRRSLVLVLCFLLVCGFLGILFAQRSGQQSSITGDSDVKDSLKQFTDRMMRVSRRWLWLATRSQFEARWANASARTIFPSWECAKP